MSRLLAHLRSLIFTASLGRAFLEALGWMVLSLGLIFFSIDELPLLNLPAAFLFLLQIPIGWAAIRTKRQSHLAFWKAAGRDVLMAFGLQLAGLFLTWGLSRIFQAQDHLQWDRLNGALITLALTVCAISYLGYRLAMGLWLAWLRLTERRLLWRMVNTHLVTVFTLIMLVSIVSRITTINTGPPAYYPPGLLARWVLEFVRAVVPWIGVSVLFAFAAMAVFFLPTLLTSYWTARRFVRRISDLAAAMKRLRQGELNARVTPEGRDEIAQLQDDFNHMAHELQQERENVARLLKNQRELAAVVSHELRTPVTVMRAYIETDLSENPEALPERYRTDLETIHHETLRLQGLIEDLFTLSQIDQNRLDLACGWVDPAGVIARVATGFKKVAWEPRQIELCAQLPPELPEIWADEGRLEQVLSNLVQNAIRHTPPGGAVLLQAEPDPQTGRVVIAVVDSGQGIDPQDLPHVWERFYRGGQGRASGRTGYTGRTGIGLSLVKELVEAMDGAVGVESQPGEGSRFWLCFTTRDISPVPEDAQA